MAMLFRSFQNMYGSWLEKLFYLTLYFFTYRYFCCFVLLEVICWEKTTGKSYRSVTEIVFRVFLNKRAIRRYFSTNIAIGLDLEVYVQFNYIHFWYVFFYNFFFLSAEFKFARSIRFWHSHLVFGL